MKPRTTRISKGRLQSSSLTTVISISLVLFLLGLLGLLVMNAQKLADFVKENIGFSVILKRDVREADIIQLQKYFDASDYVKETQYVTPEQAAEELKNELGEDFIQFLGINPLLPSIDIKLYAAYANPDSIAKIEQEFLSYPQVKEVYYQESLVHLINENIRKISVVILVFSLFLFLISVALFNNTIRLMIYSKRFIIKTMQLVGATRGYIRRPFISKGILHGITGAALAILLLLGVIYLAKQQMPELVTFTDIKIVGVLFALVILLGAILGWFSTTLAVNKFLRSERDALYL
ncbi:MAG: permease-like cell division protein FtsX [Bacteroidales bacterium]|nr:permease-like cell division protein FtsX [Bacteroidales bacterium]